MVTTLTVIKEDIPGIGLVELSARMVKFHSSTCLRLQDCESRSWQNKQCMKLPSSQLVVKLSGL